MRLGDLWRRLDLLQKTMRFKVIATIVILLVSGGLYTGIVVARNSALPDAQTQIAQPEQTEQAERVSEDTASILERQLRMQIEAAQSQTPVEAVLAAAFAIGTAMALAAVWLGLAITYLGLAITALAVAYPVSLAPGIGGVGRLALGVIPLVFILVTLLELARILLSGSHPLLAVARNLLNEAVRMKISLVFIVILLVLLAVIPTVLNEDQPLRYRIQQWMQYGTGFGYLILALMTAFFCAASVAFEQRDKIIWQTMTKPVPAWAYVVGKWSGVMVLNAVLLLVVSGGVFIFTKYLELQPASGEVAYHRIIDRSAEGGIRDTSVRGEFGEDYRTLDRRVLEDQVLVARVGITPQRTMPSEQFFQERIERRIAEMRSNDPQGFQDTQALRNELRQRLRNEIDILSRAVPLGQRQQFMFEGLERFEGTDTTFTLRYQIQAGSNDPSALYTVNFWVNGVPWPPNFEDRRLDGTRQVGLKITQVMEIPAAAINEGRIQLIVGNFPGNPQAFVFPPDGLELLYPAGGYELNFTRVNAVLLVKLGFIAAVAIALATFVSFPVAVVVTLCVLFATESAGYMSQSLESFATTTPEGNLLPLHLLARVITVGVVWMFGIYTNLSPIESLSDGRLLGWTTLANAITVIGFWTLLLLAFGVAMLRRRELAIYSGQ